MHSFLLAQWQKRGLWAWLVSPLSLLVCIVALLKRKAYRLGLFHSQTCAAPVIVVGNLTVGGTGKTPLVIYLFELLKANGYRPGIISRGYKSASQQQSLLVTPDASPEQAGDEAVLLAQRTNCPVMIGADRVKSAQDLLSQTDCNVIISDDGFQHLRLRRNIDILVRDAARGYGNGWCLPSGPLRESFSAQDDADFVIHNGGSKSGKAGHFQMQLDLGNPFELSSGKESQYQDLSSQHFHAVAAIGNPERFFSALEYAGLSISRHAFADHHHYAAADLRLGDDKPIIMTQKDAVKCTQLTLSNPVWVAPVDAALSSDFDAALLSKLKHANMETS